MNSANLCGQNNDDILNQAIVTSGIGESSPTDNVPQPDHQDQVDETWTISADEKPTETDSTIIEIFNNIENAELMAILDDLAKPYQNSERDLNTPKLDHPEPEHPIKYKQTSVQVSNVQQVVQQNQQLVVQQQCQVAVEEVVQVTQHQEQQQVQLPQHQEVEFVQSEEQDMLDPHFAPSQYVVKEHGENAPQTIKIDQLCNLNLAQNTLEDQPVLIGIIHSHPDFVEHTINGSNVKETAPNDTPFVIKHQNVAYKDVQIPAMNMTMKAAVVSLKKEKQIFIKFLIFSTDEKNHGSNKNGKEWHLITIPLSKTRAETILQSEDPPTLTMEDINPMSFLRVQVKTEARKNSKQLAKPHRRVEVKWPFNKTQERQRLEKLYIRSKKRKASQMSDEELRAKIAKY